ncbi:MAG: hypothetical protein AABW99_02560 [archaeon]
MKHILLALTLILTSYITLGATISEFTFAQQGYKDFYINGFDSYGCSEYNFLNTVDLNGEVFPIISLKAYFAPNPGREAEVKAFLNGDVDAIAELKFSDFMDGTARIWVPREKIVHENSLSVCGKTSFTVNSIKIGADSSYGVYYAPYFPAKDGFVLNLETYAPIVGKPFRVTAVAKNYGSEDASVKLDYRRSELEESLKELSVLDGTTSEEGVVPKCIERGANADCTKPGELGISYMVVANKAVPMTLLPAIITYTNIFGEQEKRLTNRPDFGAYDPPQLISAKISLDRDRAIVGEPTSLNVIVKNQSEEAVENAKITLSSNLEIIGEEMLETGALQKGEEKRLSFSVRGVEVGNYGINCLAQYNGREFSCETAQMTLERGGIGMEIISATVLLVIALGAFAYYYFKK